MKIQWKALPGDSSISSHADSDKAYLQLLIEHSPIAIVILNSSHQAKHCNPIFERMFGYTRAEIVDRNFDELIAFGEPSMRPDDVPGRYCTGKRRTWSRAAGARMASGSTSISTASR